MFCPKPLPGPESKVSETPEQLPGGKRKYDNSDVEEEELRDQQEEQRKLRAFEALVSYHLASLELAAKRQFKGPERQFFEYIFRTIVTSIHHGDSEILQYGVKARLVTRTFYQPPIGDPYLAIDGDTKWPVVEVWPITEEDLEAAEQARRETARSEEAYRSEIARKEIVMRRQAARQEYLSIYQRICRDLEIPTSEDRRLVALNEPSSKPLFMFFRDSPEEAEPGNQLSRLPQKEPTASDLVRLLERNWGNQFIELGEFVKVGEPSTQDQTGSTKPGIVSERCVEIIKLKDGEKNCSSNRAIKKLKPNREGW
ncbi:hypothetical protein F5Y16DRAFT_395775 [Xylariaceae sp. FL0255]|nr:hypothetical protein F5Y16DRAFT_395775 [Xylariaceae sp. FL0255]